MAQTLQLSNFPTLNTLAQTALTQNYASGQSSLAVINCEPFVSSSPVIVGGLGSNGSELLTTGTLSSDTTLTLSSSTNLPHSTGDLVTMLFGSDINVYSAPDSASGYPGTGVAPADSNFTKLSGMPIAIDSTMLETPYTDPAGTTTTWYKYTFWNASTSSETALSSSVPVWAYLANYCSLDEIIAKAGFTNNVNITSNQSLVDQKRQAAQHVINGALIPVYVFPLPLPIDPMIAELTRNLAAAYLTQDVYRTTNPSMVAQGEKDEAKALDDLNRYVIKEVVIINAQFNDQTIPGGNGVSGYPDDTARGFATRANGGGSQIFWPGMRY